MSSLSGIVNSSRGGRYTAINGCEIQTPLYGATLPAGEPQTPAGRIILEFFLNPIDAKDENSGVFSLNHSGAKT